MLLVVMLLTWLMSRRRMSRRRMLRVRRVPAWRSATMGVEGADSYTAFGYANPARRVLASVLRTQAELRTALPDDDADGPEAASRPHLEYTSDVVEVVGTYLYRPGRRRWCRRPGGCSRAAWTPTCCTCSSHLSPLSRQLPLWHDKASRYCLFPYHLFMRPVNDLRPGRASGESATVPTGPATTMLRSVIARFASVVRCAGIAYVVAQVVVWHSFYTADSARLAGPVAATLWAAAVTIYLRRGWPGPLFAAIDSAVYIALALTAQGCVPPATRDDALSWLVINMSSQVVVPAWYASSLLAAPLALAAPVSYWVGAERMAGTGSSTMTVAVILLTGVAAIHSYGRWALYRRAAAADAALDEADRDASEQYVNLSRNIERREHERLLHDTVLNTLTALAHADSDDMTEVTNRCRQDVARIAAALGEPVEPGRPHGDLISDVRAVAGEMRSRGLNVHVDIADDFTLAVPLRVATAISNAVREALSNVAAHAGTPEAFVEVSGVASAGSAKAPDRLQVSVRDFGAGFDLAQVDPARLGLRRSIAERIADCGGKASIWSAPGEGTLVCVAWPAPAQVAAAARARALERLPW